MRTIPARIRVQVAVDPAREAGAGWTQIGDALGLKRGNAYQQFRKLSAPSSRPLGDAAGWGSPAASPL